MNEVKTPKKPLIYYYSIFFAFILLFNILIMPMISQMRIEEVDYSTFVSMTINGEIGKVEIQDNKILFTNKSEEKVYETGIIDDPMLTERLIKYNVDFAGEIIEEMSPLLSMLLSWILPMGVMILLGQLVAKKMTDKAGGGPGSMMFNMGKSNAKVYTKLKRNKK